MDACKALCGRLLHSFYLSFSSYHVSDEPFGTAVTVLTVADPGDRSASSMSTLLNIKSNLVGPVLVRTRVALDR